MLDLIVPILKMLSQILSLRLRYGAVWVFHISSLWFFFLNVLWLCLTFVNIWLILSQSGYLGKTPKLWVHFFSFSSFFFTSAVLNSILPLYKILQGASPQMPYLWLVSFLLEKKLYDKLEVCVCVRVSMGTHLTGGMQRVVETGGLSCSLMFTV